MLFKFKHLILAIQLSAGKKSVDLIENIKNSLQLYLLVRKK
jgi:hypothetical protein